MIKINISGKLPAYIKKTDVNRAIDSVFMVTRKKNTGLLSISFISDTKIKILNKVWLNHDRPTDVLSFAPPEELRHKEEVDFGDIFLAPAFINKQAKMAGVPVRIVLLLTIVHGILHLLGYDHANLKERQKMFKLQERIMKKAL